MASFSPTDFVILPSEEAWVERRPNGDWVVRWRQAAERATISISDDPDDLTAAHRPSFVVSGAELLIPQASVVASVGDARPYFLLDLDGRRLVVAERTLPLANGVNFRDVGGYRTADGRFVRWGGVYRSGSLAELSDDAVAYLARLGLRLSCDLRSTEEVQTRPDRLPAQTAALHRPIAAEVSRLRRVVTLFRLRHRIQELLLNVYTVMIDQNGPIFAGFVRLAADADNLPLVVHCTAGKDRTGLAVAILLLALGVPEEMVIADYTLSNNAFDVLVERMQPEMERLYAFGFKDTQVRPFLLAEARTMTAALAHLRRRYGSVEWYLLRSGVTEETLEQLRGTLLTTDY